MTTQTPTYPQYTNLALGEGVFDQLMFTINAHIEKQYDAQRIKGPDYSKVYLGSMEAALNNSTQFLLGTMLLEEQREKMRLEAINLALQGEVLELQKEKLRFEMDYLYPAQLIKLEQEGLLIEAQVEKINKEIEYLTAKIQTELYNYTEGAAGLIGRQMALLTAQKLGFAGELEIKVSKLHADYQAIWQSVQEVESERYLGTMTEEAAAWVAEHNLQPIGDVPSDGAAATTTAAEIKAAV
jgi:hypothetical protein